FTFGHIKNTDIITRITIMNLDSNNNNLIINKMKEVLAKQTNNKVALFAKKDLKYQAILQNEFE
ncbi:MAG: hypothetical protein ACFE9T_12865, partial [Promethearchaeota archaeon]